MEISPYQDSVPQRLLNRTSSLFCFVKKKRKATFLDALRWVASRSSAGIHSLPRSARHRVVPDCPSEFQPLQKKKWIRQLDNEPQDRKIEYIITETGKQFFELELIRLEELMNNTRIVKEKNNENNS